MTPLAYTWPHGLLFWPVFLWAYGPEFAIIRQARRSQTATDGKSLQVILFGQAAAFFAAFPLGWVPALQFPASLRAGTFYFGLALVMTGSLLRRHCWRMLGASFTGDVRANPDQPVVTRGAYRFVRHPSYTAGILLNTGLGVVLGGWVSALLLAASSIAVYLYRMAIEERTLLAIIGEPYREFMRTRKRLIPWLY
jgi:protein-S-isoprenylcysteine O-methyltransferase Ste14